MGKGVWVLLLCAVITPAHRASPWILGCLESIKAQEPLTGWTYESRVGVDGCEETSATLTAAGVGHWFSRENVGPFLIRNALMRNPADAYALFDADDIMLPHYLRSLLAVVGDGIAGSARIEVNERGEPRKGSVDKPRPYGNGVAVFSRAAMEKLGGFRPWRIAADPDAILRAKKMGIPIRRVREPGYYRRSHPAALTKAPDTAIGSKARATLKNLSVKLSRNPENWRVAPVCAELEWRGAERVAA